MGGLLHFDTQRRELVVLIACTYTVCRFLTCIVHQFWILILVFNVQTRQIRVRRSGSQ